jgi:hypothetical protein
MCETGLSPTGEFVGVTEGHSSDQERREINGAQLHALRTRGTIEQEPDGACTQSHEKSFFRRTRTMRTLCLPRLHAHTASQSSDVPSPLLPVLRRASLARLRSLCHSFLFPNAQEIAWPQVLLAKAAGLRGASVDTAAQGGGVDAPGARAPLLASPARARWGLRRVEIASEVPRLGQPNAPHLVQPRAMGKVWNECNWTMRH